MLRFKNSIWRMKKPLILVCFISFPFSLIAPFAKSHSGGLNKQGCHSGSQPYHCHRKNISALPKALGKSTLLSGIVTHVRDGDTIELNGIAIRLAALNCPENKTKEGKSATRIAKKFEGSQIICELTGAKTYDRLVGYCSIDGVDYGRFMIKNSSCKVWEKYDVWDRY